MTDRNGKHSVPGLLYFCATPIGNLKDITLRALECMKSADYIAVENVNRSRKLLTHYEIETPLMVFRESNRDKKGREILKRVQGGETIVLITDAGLPAISDPGFSLVEMAVKEGVPFTVLPGPSAALTALLRSGFTSSRFVFWGFLSRKKKERREELLSIAADPKTAVIYEAPHRLLQTLQEMETILGERSIAVCRELTKRFEEVLKGTPGELRGVFQERAPRGEITLVVAPGVSSQEFLLQEDQALMHLKSLLDRGIPPGEAVKRTVRRSALKRSEVYEMMLQLQGKK